MAQREFLHGVEVKTAPVVQAAADVNMSVIGVIGIAPYADPDVWPLDRPVLVSGSDRQKIGALTKTAPTDAVDVGTLPDAFAAMLDECSPLVVAVRVAGQTSYNAADIPRLVGGIDGQGAYHGVHVFLASESMTGYRPRLLCAPGYTHQASKAALVGVTVSDAGSGYTAGTYPLTITDKTGTGAQAQIIIGDDGKIASVNVTANGSGYSAPTFSLPAEAGKGTGGKLEADLSDLDNAVAAELKTIANRLRAVVFIDGPNSNAEDAIKAAAQGGDRVMMIDPWLVRETDGVSKILPPSAKFAALQSYSDQTYGFWRSVSNQPLHGVTGLARPVDFVLGDQNSAANILNANYISTIIRRAGTGYVSWGNRALDGSFLCVTRVTDEICDALMLAVITFLDMGIDKNFVTEVVSFVNAYLRQMISKGAITGGTCWADTSLNTASAVTNGQVFFDFDYGPIYPAERITFRASINDGYVSTIFSNEGTD
ncbi:phage tail sheath subtilisin-like domain-containing protein [Acetobacteraceae bacterium ESL0709]|nr:phage tail sheath subtilisin-like domain-containing protein [Acetobacteraceae bacterium ESL0697]MDF7677377.1 phage tail sheath subtilisin-like domain-containing protein [Acetobacteraceae bacterium ESL0709]